MKKIVITMEEVGRDVTVNLKNEGDQPFMSSEIISLLYIELTKLALEVCGTVRGVDDD